MEVKPVACDSENWRLYEIACIQASVAWLEQKIASDQAEIKRLNERLKFLVAVRYEES